MNKAIILLTLFVGLSLATYIILSWGKTYWQKRIGDWAGSRGYLLLEYRAATFFEGPGKWTRTENQTAFRVKVREKSGNTREGWIVFGKKWNPLSRPDELTEEKWD